MTEPFGKSPFHSVKGKDMPHIDMKDLKKYYDDDPEVQEMMRIAKEGMLSATWQQKLYAEIFHQMILYDNIVDLDKCKKIISEGIKR